MLERRIHKAASFFLLIFSSIVFVKNTIGQTNNNNINSGNITSNPSDFVESYHKEFENDEDLKYSLSATDQENLDRFYSLQLAWPFIQLTFQAVLRDISKDCPLSIWADRMLVFLSASMILRIESYIEESEKTSKLLDEMYERLFTLDQWNKRHLLIANFNLDTDNKAIWDENIVNFIAVNGLSQYSCEGKIQKNSLLNQNGNSNFNINTNSEGNSLCLTGLDKTNLSKLTHIKVDEKGVVTPPKDLGQFEFFEWIERLAQLEESFALKDLIACTLDLSFSFVELVTAVYEATTICKIAT